MPLLTPAALKTHIETDLPEGALERIIAREEAEILRYAGGTGPKVARLPGFSRLLTLPSAAASITSIVEDNGGEWTQTLATDDYLLWPSGLVLQRRYEGTHSAAVFPRWVTVTYTPRDDDSRHVMALVDLCKLSIQYNGLQSERVGDYSSQSGDYQRMRDAILRSIAPGRGWSVA